MVSMRLSLRLSFKVMVEWPCECLMAYNIRTIANISQVQMVSHVLQSRKQAVSFRTQIYLPFKLIRFDLRTATKLLKLMS
jgi:hypothetical protein